MFRCPSESLPPLSLTFLRCRTGATKRFKTSMRRHRVLGPVSCGEGARPKGDNRPPLEIRSGEATLPSCGLPSA